MQRNGLRRLVTVRRLYRQGNVCATRARRKQGIPIYGKSRTGEGQRAGDGFRLVARLKRAHNAVPRPHKQVGFGSLGFLRRVCGFILRGLIFLLGILSSILQGLGFLGYLRGGLGYRNLLRFIADAGSGVIAAAVAIVAICIAVVTVAVRSGNTTPTKVTRVVLIFVLDDGVIPIFILIGAFHRRRAYLYIKGKRAGIRSVCRIIQCHLRRGCIIARKRKCCDSCFACFDSRALCGDIIPCQRYALRQRQHDGIGIGACLRPRHCNRINRERKVIDTVLAYGQGVLLRRAKCNGRHSDIEPLSDCLQLIFRQNFFPLFFLLFLSFLAVLLRIQRAIERERLIRDLNIAAVGDVISARQHCNIVLVHVDGELGFPVRQHERQYLLNRAVIIRQGEG